jgi:hypothetical protein
VLDFAGFLAAGYCLAWGIEGTLQTRSARELLWGIIGALVVVQAVFVIAHRTHAWPRRPLPEGALRDRLEELAEDAGLGPARAFVVPAAWWRLVNAFDRSVERLYVAPAVLPRLSRREVDALLAHEIVRRDRVRIGYFLGPWKPALWAGATLLMLGLLLAWDQDPYRAWPLGVACLVAAVRLRTGEHVSRGRDRDVVALTHDAEALITALIKLRDLDLLLLPHEEPAAFTDRLRAIAAYGGIPGERMREIIASPTTGSESYPPLDDSWATDDRS